MLKIKNLTKVYGGVKRAVDDITFAVDPGTICAFIGHNGAGKTTTLKAIAGIINFDGGEILVDNIDVNVDPIAAKSRIAYLPDSPELYDFLKGIDYLNFIADVFLIDGETRKERIEKYTKKLEIFDVLNSKISTYSHGMKQKLAVVSALLHKPKLYLFDEPFVGLDPKSAHAFKEIIQEECKLGNSFLYSTHVLDVAEKLATHVVLIKNGKIVVDGKMKDIKGDSSLEKLFLEYDKNE